MSIYGFYRITRSFVGGFSFFRVRQQPPAHVPELLLHVHPGGLYLDGTFGVGGHTAEILDRGGRVYALDYDEISVQQGQERFADAISAHALTLAAHSSRTSSTRALTQKNFLLPP